MRRKDPRAGLGVGLTWRFATAAMVAFVLVGLILTVTVGREVVDREVRDGELRAETIARSMMGLYIAEGGSLTPASGDRLAGLNALMRLSVLRWPVVRLKVWRDDGTVLFSDDPALIGRRYPLEAELGEAFRSTRTVSDVTDLTESENVDERPLASKLLETYVPQDFSGQDDGGAPRVVVEVYQDYSSIQSQANRVRGTIGVLLLIGLGVLYVLMLPIVRRVSRTLIEQNATLSAQRARLEEVLDEERDTAADRRRLLDRSFRSDEEERRRIATELHDGPLHDLAIIGVTLDRVHVRLDQDDPASARPLLEGAQQELSDSIQDLRSLMRGLRPPALDERGLEAAIADHADALMNESGVEYELVSTIGSRPEPVIEGVLYRVAQEAVANVSLHAHAKHARLSLERRNGSVLFEMRDDGEGFDPHEIAGMTLEGRFGLTTMRERVEMVGGSLEIDSTPGGGTLLRATLPCSAVEP